MPSIVVLGLLGGVGSGKSTVARLFAERGAEILDADRIGHDCLEVDPIKEEVVSLFGIGAVGADGRIDRRHLADRVFTDDALRGRLEGLVHPCVRERIETKLSELRAEGRARVAVLDVPLLLESPLDGLCDARVFIDTPRAIREERVRSTRGWDANELARREKTQLPIDTKRAAADYMMENASSLEAARAQVGHIHDDLLSKSDATPPGADSASRTASIHGSESNHEDGAKANGSGKLPS